MKDSFDPIHNISMQLGDEAETLMTIALWKAVGTNPIMLTPADLARFNEEMSVGAQLMIHGTEDGVRVQVLTSEKAQRFVEEYKATQKGIVVRNDLNNKAG